MRSQSRARPVAVVVFPGFHWIERITRDSAAPGIQRARAPRVVDRGRLAILWIDRALQGSSGEPHHVDELAIAASEMLVRGPGR